MINYSIVMRSVNSNLIDINKAKGRINAALAAGEQPLQEDLNLVATETQKAYAIAQYADVMTIEKFAKHISEHGCVYSRADISAILYMAVDCMREQLLDGKKIRLGDLGDFSVSLVSKGADTADKFNAGSHITGINVTWDCGQEFKNLIADAEFNLVASRAAQAAVLKAIKAGNTTVDLTGGNDNDDDNPGGGSGNTPSGGGSTSTGGGNTTRQYTLNISSADTSKGTVDTSVNKTYSEGSRVNIKATPASGYVFDKWSDGNTSASRTVTMNANTTLVASFIASTGSGTGTQGGSTGDNEDDPSFL